MMRGRRAKYRAPVGPNPTSLIKGAVQGNLLAWARWLDPTYLWPRHIRLLADALQKVERGEITRLIVEMPPRHGKSALASKIFPSWYLGRNPDHRVILASHTSSLAKTNSREVRNGLHEHGPAVYGLSVATDSAAVDKWDLASPHKGGLIAAGVGGGLTGHGSDLLIIDDPIKGAEEAHSTLQKDKIWDWYQAVARTRLHPGGKIIIIATRWALDDLTGRVLEGAEPWARISLSALAEDDDPLGRAPGEALWPERYTAADLEAVSKELGEYVWNALYQQRPYDISGGIFRQEQLKNRFQLDDRLMKRSTDWMTSWDLSFKETKAGSYVVGQVWCRKGADAYMLDQVRARMDFSATLQAMLKMVQKWPRANLHLVEEKANGAAILSALRNKIPGLVPVKPTGSKEARAHAVAPLFEAGNVHLLEGAGWVDNYVAEFLAFPRGMADDQVDATTQALNRMQRQMADTTTEWDLDLSTMPGGSIWVL